MSTSSDIPAGPNWLGRLFAVSLIAFLVGAIAFVPQVDQFVGTGVIGPAQVVALVFGLIASGLMAWGLETDKNALKAFLFLGCAAVVIGVKVLAAGGTFWVLVGGLAVAIVAAIIKKRLSAKDETHGLLHI